MNDDVYVCMSVGGTRIVSSAYTYFIAISGVINC